MPVCALTKERLQTLEDVAALADKLLGAQKAPFNCIDN